mgnify:CR=1 FL=1
MQCIYGSYMVWVVFDQATPGFIGDSLQAMNQNQMVNRRLTPLRKKLHFIHLGWLSGCGGNS